MDGARLSGSAPLPQLGSSMKGRGFSIWCLIGAAAGVALLFGAAAEPRQAVARVNGALITSGELETEIDRLAPSAVSEHGKATDNAALRKKALEELIVRELAYQQAKQQRLTVTSAEMNATVAKIKGHYRSDKSFREALEAEQIGQQEFLRRVEKDLLLRKVYKREIDDKATVARGEVEEYYRQHKAKFVMPDSVRLLQIWTDWKQPSAKSKIEEALAKLKSGTPFFDVAYRYSDDDYRVVGGDYGWVHKGQLAPELEKLAFSAPLKTLVGPIHTSFGWHILRVEEHLPERQLPVEEARPKIEETLHRERLAQRRSEFTRRLRQNARIEYLAP
jgi:parvulin-like peptidyl-prolyl isomerase